MTRGEAAVSINKDAQKMSTQDYWENDRNIYTNKEEDQVTEQKENTSLLRHTCTRKHFETATWEFEQKNIILSVQSHQVPL